MLRGNLRRENPTYRYLAPVAAARRGFKMVLFTASRRNTFVGGTCALPSALLVFLIWSLSWDRQMSYKHFPSMGTFSHKFSIAPNGETTGWIRKCWADKLGRTSCITMPSLVGIIRHTPVVDKKSIMCFFVRLSNYEVCENGKRKLY